MTQKAGFIIAGFFCLILMPVAANGKASADTETFRTIWREYFDIYGVRAAYPFQFEGHVGKMVFTYHGIGFGSSGFEMRARDLFGGSADSLRAMIGFISPIYLYCTPVGAHRKSGEVTPFVVFSYLGWCGWGIKKSSLFDVGIGFHYHVIELSAGYNSVATENRYFFLSSNEPENFGRKWSGFYVGVNLSAGPWLALSSRSVKRAAADNNKNE